MAKITDIEVLGATSRAVVRVTLTPEELAALNELTFRGGDYKVEFTIRPAMPDQDAQDGAPLRVYFTPRQEGVQPHYTMEHVGTPKKYMHVWLKHSGPAIITWGWVLHESAVLLWQRDQGHNVEEEDDDAA